MLGQAVGSVVADAIGVYSLGTVNAVVEGGWVVTIHLVSVVHRGHMEHGGLHGPNHTLLWYAEGTLADRPEMKSLLVRLG